MNIKTGMVVSSLFVFLIGFIIAHVCLSDTSGNGWFNKLRLYIYFPLTMWCLVYYLVCLCYAGYRLSLVWMWLLFALFGAVRITMIIMKMEGALPFVIPVFLKVVYYVVFTAGTIFFLVVEYKVVDDMTAYPPADLEYIVVLGAGLQGRQPSNPLKVRIKRAAEYMEENPDTILIASGGQGPTEIISEAECIKEQLTDVYGIDPDRIIMEQKSTNTIENLKYSLELIGDPEHSVGIVSNGFHEHRAMLIAGQAGYKNVTPVPSTTLLPVGVHYIVREFFGVVSLYLGLQGRV